MIHLLYDRVDRDSALITDHPICHVANYLSRIRREEARKPGSKQGGVGGEGGRRLEVEFFVPHGSSYRSVLFLSAGDGAEIAFYGDRFDSDLLSSSPIPRDWWVISDSDNGIRSFVRSDDQRIRYDACGKRG